MNTWTPPPRFGTALHFARLLRGFSRAQVAKESGVPAGRLKYIEEGRDEPDAHELQRIWRVLASGVPAPGRRDDPVSPTTSTARTARVT